MALDPSALVETLAKFDAENRLTELDQTEFPETGVLRWLFGLSAGFYFANDQKIDRRAAMIDLAEAYYERTAGRCNCMVDDQRSFRLKAVEDIRRNLTEGAAAKRYENTDEVAGFYITQMRASAARSLDPAHDLFSCLLPGSVVPNGTLSYSSRLNLLQKEPDQVVSDFVAVCEKLKVFYAVQGFAVLANLSSGAQRELYPLLRRFPGLLYEDTVGFSIEIEKRADVIRDVNWLTAIDDAMVERIGGIDHIRSTLSDEAEVHRFDGGIVFQAGPAPSIGDIDHHIIPSAYRAVSNLLRPLRFENWLAPYIRVPRDVNAMAFTAEWIRRFD